MNDPGWRRTLRLELSWLMALKLAGLVLLWWLFFSPAHRQAVDGASVSRRLAVAPRAVGGGPTGAAPPRIAPQPAARERRDD